MREALGFFEVRGLPVAVEAADCMVKAADVTLKDFNYVGSGIISVIVSGEVSAVNSAIEAARERLGASADIISVNVIPRPNPGVDDLLE